MDADTYFSAEEQEKIRQAIEAAESRTSGEIVPMIVSVSGRYAEANVAGLIIGLVIGSAAALLWHDPWRFVHAELTWPLLGAAVGLALSHISSIKRLFIPAARMIEAVHIRSLAAFTAHGLHYTKAHTGILILASLFERRVVVLADRGINDKVRPGTWDEIVGIIAAGLKSKNGAAAFCTAIERCGNILAEHFPRSPDDRNELENALIKEQ
jgi:putative membrane protein